MTADGQPGYKKDGADTVYPFNAVIYKPGNGPWDFSAEFSGGVGFDINNCFAVVMQLTAMIVSNATGRLDATKAFKPYGSYNSVQSPLDSGGRLLYGAPGAGSTLYGSLMGCLYIRPED